MEPGTTTSPSGRDEWLDDKTLRPSGDPVVEPIKKGVRRDVLTCGHVISYYVGSDVRERWGRCRSCGKVARARRPGEQQKPSRGEYIDASRIQITGLAVGKPAEFQLDEGPIPPSKPEDIVTAGNGLRMILPSRVEMNLVGKDGVFKATYIEYWAEQDNGAMENAYKIMATLFSESKLCHVFKTTTSLGVNLQGTREQVADCLLGEFFAWSSLSKLTLLDLVGIMAQSEWTKGEKLE